MRSVIDALVFGVTVSSGTASAGVHDLAYVDSARVVWAKPIYETVEVSRPVREYWTERVVHRRMRRASHGAPPSRSSIL